MIVNLFAWFCCSDVLIACKLDASTCHEAVCSSQQDFTSRKLAMHKNKRCQVTNRTRFVGGLASIGNLRQTSECANFSVTSSKPLLHSRCTLLAAGLRHSKCLTKICCNLSNPPPSLCFWGEAKQQEHSPRKQKNTKIDTTNLCWKCGFKKSVGRVINIGRYAQTTWRSDRYLAFFWQKYNSATKTKQIKNWKQKQERHFQILRSSSAAMWENPPFPATRHKHGGWPAQQVWGDPWLRPTPTPHP